LAVKPARDDKTETLQVPMTKIVIPRVFPDFVRSASVALMLPPRPQSTLMGAAAKTVDVARQITTSKVIHVHVRDFILFSSLFREWRFSACPEWNRR
jgi:hypothetical protein